MAIVDASAVTVALQRFGSGSSIRKFETSDVICAVGISGICTPVTFPLNDATSERNCDGSGIRAESVTDADALVPIGDAQIPKIALSGAATFARPDVADFTPSSAPESAVVGSATLGMSTSESNMSIAPSAPSASPPSPGNSTPRCPGS